MKRLGIIGGLGPETGCNFCLSINNQFREKTNCQPDIVLENLPVSAEAEARIINGEPGTEHLELLSKAVRRMNQAEVDLIVIPCNTVHVFMEELRKASKKPILSIIEETVKACCKAEVKKIGLLASGKTIKEKLYARAFQSHSIEMITPEKQEQLKINKVIIRILNNQAIEQDKQFLISLVNKMKLNKAESIVLGCTDLPLLIKQEDVEIPLISTLACLENAVLKELLL